MQTIVKCPCGRHVTLDIDVIVRSWVENGVIMTSHTIENAILSPVEDEPEPPIDSFDICPPRPH